MLWCNVSNHNIIATCCRESESLILVNFKQTAGKHCERCCNRMAVMSYLSTNIVYNWNNLLECSCAVLVHDTISWLFSFMQNTNWFQASIVTLCKPSNFRVFSPLFVLRPSPRVQSLLSVISLLSLKVNSSSDVFYLSMSFCNLVWEDASVTALGSVCLLSLHLN